jgi:hypothetical protein
MLNDPQGEFVGESKMLPKEFAGELHYVVGCIYHAVAHLPSLVVGTFMHSG